MNAIPWYKSAIIRAILIAIVLRLMAWLHVAGHFTSDDVAQLVDNALDFFALVAAGAGIGARVNQASAPTIVAGPKTADKLNTTSPPEEKQ